MSKVYSISLSRAKEEAFNLLREFCRDLKFVFYESLHSYRQEQYRNQNLGLYQTASLYQGMVECCYLSINSINKIEKELEESFSKRLNLEAIFNKALKDLESDIRTFRIRLLTFYFLGLNRLRFNIN